MSAVEPLLNALRTAGVALRVEDGQLRYSAPKGALSDELREKLRAERSAIIAYLDAARTQTRQTIPRRPSDEPTPLSFQQQRLWFLHELDGANAAYNIAHALRLTGPLDRAALLASLEAIVARHETLRTAIGASDGAPAQVIAATLVLSLEETDLRALPEERREIELRSRIEAMAQEPFDLTRPPLFRLALLQLGESEHVVVLVMHHMISDGWSLGVMLREIRALYAARLRGEAAALPTLDTQYGDFAHWQRSAETGASLRSSLAYWTQQLTGVPPVIDLPTDRPRRAMAAPRGATVSLAIDERLARRIYGLAKETGASLFMTLLAGFAAVLARYAGTSDLVIGTASANRNRTETEPLIGFFANTIALRLDTAGNPSFRTLIDRVRRTSLDAYAHEDVPFEQLVEALHPQRDLRHIPLVQVMFRVESAQMVGRVSLPGIEVEPVVFDRGFSTFDLTLMVRETGRELLADFEFRSDLFERATIVRLADHWRRLLEAAVAAPDTPVGLLPLIGEEERRTVLIDWSRTAPPSAERGLVLEAIAQRAASAPAAPALVFGNEAMSYSELEAQANRLARHLVALGVGPERIVAFCLERSAAMIVLALAALKTGGAYLPLDPATPDERIARILARSGALIAFVEPTRREALRRHRVGAALRCLADDTAAIAAAPATQPHTEIRPQNLAYVIYTSGSTGEPKGVMIEHRSLANLVAALGDVGFRSEQPLRVALIASLGFDASVQQIFAALTNGHALHIVDDETRRDGEQLKRFLIAHRIDLADGTPSLLATLTAVGLPNAMELALRRLVIGGEALPAAQIAAFYAGDAARHIRIANVYGPTECCVDVASLDIDAAHPSAAASMPIGRPMAGNRLYVLDSALRPAPIGVRGEIFVSGPQVGRGYLGDPAQTAERFIPDPRESGGRLYCSGDIGRWLADGTIEFLGRSDFQVKIRGYRIELGEIEARLRTHPLVSNALVIARAATAGHAELVAYIVTAAAPSVPELRRYLGATLPDYMLPQHFVPLAALPLTSSGKINRMKLPPPEATTAGQGVSFIAPRDTREAALQDIWASVLGKSRIGIRDNYFALGGDSIKALQIAARLRQAGFRLEMRDIFLAPTIEELAPRLKTIVRVAPQAETDAAAPLTAIEARFFATFGGNLNHFNQTILLDCTERIDQTTLAAALATLQSTHDTLRTSFSKDRENWCKSSAKDVAPIPLDLIDLRGAADPDRSLAADAGLRQADADIGRAPLLRAVLYRLERHDRLLLIAHHLITDGVSWRILIEDLDTAYGQIRDGIAVTLPPPAATFAHWSRRIADYARGLLEPEIAYWHGLPRRLSGLPYDREASRATIADLAIRRVVLAPELTQDLLTRANHAYRTEINDLLLTALARSFARDRDAPHLSLMLEGHGRETLFDDIDAARTVGWLTTLYPVALPGDTQGDLGRHIKEVKEVLRRIPRKGVGYGMLKYLVPERVGEALPAEPRLAFNYLGQANETASGRFSLASGDVGAAVDPAASLQFDLEIVGLCVHGRLGFDFVYNCRRFEPGTIARLAATYLSQLEEVIAHTRARSEAELTPSDIDYKGFDIDGLDAFLGGIAKG
ncbi:MAG TPA: amino acid adenylation domain-containing protein [Stellaceae bacterium]